MHLKSLILYGFKSFANETRFEFGKGVSCIIGPNGCGKSNICDAIRWALGETRAKAVRGGTGNSMSDIIFKGSVNRKKMKFSEVTLTFDTSEDNAIEGDTLSVTRKLLITGESSYFLNGKKCNLKDISEKFRDTGIGKDGYSIVGQGKIDAVLSNKPEDRRKVFEEAAGISQARIDRENTLNHLNKTTTELLAVESELREQEHIIEPLRKQAEDADKAKRLSARIRELDINEFLYSQDTGNKKRTALEQQLEKETNEEQTLQQEANDADAAYRLFSQQSAELADKQTESMNRLTDLKIKFSGMTEKSNALAQNRNRLIGEIDAGKSTLTDKETELTSERNHLQSYRSEQTALTEERAQTEPEWQEKDRESKEMLEKLREKQNQIDIYNRMLVSGVKKEGDINANIARLKAQQQNLEENNNIRKEEIKKLTAEYNAQTKLIDGYNESLKTKKAKLADHQSDKREIENKFGALLKDIENCDEQLNNYTASIIQIQSQITNLNYRKENNSDMNYATKSLMNCKLSEVQKRVIGSIGSMVSLRSPRFEKAIGVALGPEANCVVVPNGEDANYLIGYLKAQQLGRVTFYPLTRMEARPFPCPQALEEKGAVDIATEVVRINTKYQRVVDYLLGRTLIAETDFDALNISDKYKKYGIRVISLDGSVYNASGAVTGGSLRKDIPAYFSIDTDLTAAKSKLEKAEAAKAHLETSKKELLTQKKSLEDANTILSNTIARMNVDIGSLEKDNMYAEQARIRTEGEIDKRKQEITEDSAKIAEKEAEILAQSAQSDRADEEKETPSEVLARLSDEKKSLQTESDEASEKCATLYKKLTQQINRLSEMEGLIQGAERSIVRLEADIETLKKTVADKQTELKDVETEINNLTVENLNDDEIREAQAAYDKLVEQKKCVNEQMQDAYGRVQTVNRSLADASAAVIKSKTQIENLTEDLKQLEADIYENYQIDYDTACGYRFDDYNHTACVAENKQLKKSLAAIGKVNPKAAEELAVQEELYQERMKHYTDIKESRDKLSERVNDITQEMEKKFMTAFERIKNNFSQIFSALFGGGKGILSLDVARGQSVLEAGIEIAAEPPGKKLANLELLSGGERSLIGIAIVCAMIRLHSLPFCVLDEVDAALDEVNADLYARFLRQFSEYTQFIIISHRHPTIALATQLYGITMEEYSVSNQFSVALGDEETLKRLGAH